MTWNWSWIANKQDTKKSSNSVDQSGGTLPSFRAASRGVLRIEEVVSSFDAMSTNINRQWSLWQSHIRPLMDSLPSGTRDERWRPGTGLPEKIDALTYGIQGATLFVFNDATSSIADGKYWNSTEERPITIAESIEDLWDSISELTATSTTTTEDTSLETLWRAIGHRYQDSTLTSLSTSLDSRVGNIETSINQLDSDIYGTLGYGLGTPLNYSIAKNIDVLLKLHNITSGWQHNPSPASHSGVTAAAHVHPYSEVKPMLNTTLVQDRTTGPYVSLENEIKRIRYEIQRIRFGTSGGTWQTDPNDPVTSLSDGNLYAHINRTGAGTISVNNPHGVSYINTGAETVFSVIRSYTGMTNNTDSSPTYSSTNYVTDGQSLESAIGTLDNSIYTAIVATTLYRYDVASDRSHMSETDRANSPITVNHNIGRIPMIQVLDRTPDLYDYWGMYSSPTNDAIINHIDENSCEVWTDAAIVDIICIG